MEEPTEMVPLVNATEDAEVVCITKLVEGEADNDETQLHLDLDVLREVLTQDDIADLPVAVYSVVGPSRSGKSHFLNLMMRHWKDTQHEDNADRSVASQTNAEHPTVQPTTSNAVVLFASSHVPLLGRIGKNKNRSQASEPLLENTGNTEREMLKNVFPWRGGTSADTQGIFILKKPLVFKQTNGCQAALFFVDTQGFFDMNTSEQEHKMMGALNFLMSSKQIFNIKSTIESTHIDHIVKFANLAEEIRKKNRKCTPFQQQSLIFTVRDWEIKDYPVGFGGGKAYLETRIKGKKKRATEHDLKRERLMKTFGDILCYLLPPPESKVRKMGEEDHSCFIDEIGQNFLEKAQEFFEDLLAHRQIILKKINGRTVSCRQLYDYLDAYASIINSEEGLEENTQHFLEVDAITEINHLIQEYTKTFMQNLWSQLSTERDDKQKQQSTFDLMHKNTMVLFDAAPKPEVLQLVSKYRKVLDNLLQRIYKTYQNAFKAEGLYEEAMLDFHKYVEEITPEYTLMYKNIIERATEELENRANDLKQKIHENISEQCCEYFLKEGKAWIDYTDKKQNAKVAKNVAIGLGATAAVAAAACPPLIIFGPLTTTVIGIVSAGVAAASAAASGTTAGVGIPNSWDGDEVQLASSVFCKSPGSNFGSDGDITKGYSTRFEVKIVLGLKFGKVKFLI